MDGRAWLLVALLCSCAVAERLPGYEMLGKSFNCLDVAYGGKSIVNALGNGSRVLAFSSSFKQAETQPATTNWQIPRNTFTTFYERCSWHTESHTVHAAWDFQQQMSTAFSAGYSTPAEESDYAEEYGATLSPSYRETSSVQYHVPYQVVQSQLNYTRFMFDSNCVCQDFRIDFGAGKAYTSTGFNNAVLNLPMEFNSLDSSNFMQFFDEYGTHVADGFVSGGMVAQRMTISIKSYGDLVQRNMDVEASVSAEFSSELSVPVTFPEHQAEFREVTTKAGMIIAGGDESIADSFEAWRPTVTQNPVPVRLSVQPLFKMLTRENFGGSVYITDRAAAMNTALQYYLQLRGSTAGLLPTFKMCQRAAAKTQNECEAQCPSGYVVIGGACNVKEAEKEEWPWRMSKSVTSNNGWMCRSGDDYNSPKEYFRTVYSMAWCMPQAIESRMSPPAGQAIKIDVKKLSCDLSRSSVETCITEACPSDYLLVGGGCEGPLTNSHHPPMITASAPAGGSDNNRWKCALRSDSGSPVPALVVAKGFAMCANWTSTFLYRPAHYGYNIKTCSAREQHGVQERHNTCHAKCDPGYIVVGGGCEAQSGWRLSRSWPLENGWFCEGGEDWGSKTYDKEVVGYAICMRFNVDDATP